MRIRFPGWVLMAVWLAAGAMVFSQSPGGGGGPMSPEQIQQNMTRMLANVHSNPPAKSQAMERMKQRMATRGLTDADTRMAEIGKVLDEAVAMSDADFEKNQAQLVARIMTQIRSGPGPGAGPGAATGAGTVGPSVVAGGGEGKMRIINGGSVVSEKPANLIPWIDVHDHLVGANRDFSGAASAGVAMMGEFGLVRMIVMPPPMVEGLKVSDCESFLPAIRPHASHIAFLGGGGSLNVMLQQSARQSSVSESVKRQFEQRAEAILQLGASGFGEMAAHHLSLHGSDHPYESVAADHPLLLLLADIAARHDVPIDIHFDLVVEDLPLPGWLTSPVNPAVLHANLAPFERLLTHNPKAKICWAHAGSDMLGFWTVELSRRMLEAHPNLYMSLRLGPGRAMQNFPLENGQIKPDWLKLLQDFPNRFVIGDDQFVVAKNSSGTGVGFRVSSKAPASRLNTQTFLNALPADLARKIGLENAIAIYKLKI